MVSIIYLSKTAICSDQRERIITIKAISHGVPQGSVLGPLLFILYINEMHNLIKSCKIHHFANDNNLLSQIAHLKRLTDK